MKVTIEVDNQKDVDFVMARLMEMKQKRYMDELVADAVRKQLQ